MAQEFSNAEEAFSAYKKAIDTLCNEAEAQIQAAFTDPIKMNEVLFAHNMVSKPNADSTKKSADEVEEDERAEELPLEETSKKYSAEDLDSVLAILAEGYNGFDGDTHYKEKKGFKIKLDPAAKQFIAENHFPFALGFQFYSLFYKLRGDILASGNIAQIHGSAQSLIIRLTEQTTGDTDSSEYFRYQTMTQGYESNLKAQLLNTLHKQYNHQLTEALQKSATDKPAFNAVVLALFKELERQPLSYKEKNAILQVALATVDPNHSLLQGVSLPAVNKQVAKLTQKPVMSKLKGLLLAIVGIGLIGLSIAGTILLASGSDTLSKFGLSLVTQGVVAVAAPTGVGMTYCSAAFFKPVESQKSLKVALDNVVTAATSASVVTSTEVVPEVPKDNSGSIADVDMISTPSASSS